MTATGTESRPHGHYFKDVRHLDYIDVYRVIDLFAVEHPAMQHALKKVIAAGQRGAKSTEQDAREAIDSLNRYLQMVAEDVGNPPVEDSMDWTPWAGGEQPPETLGKRVRWRDDRGTEMECAADSLTWDHRGDSGIIPIGAYKVVK